MVELLAVLGLKEAGGLVVSVLGPLIQGSLESYTQDFLKNCVGEVAGLAQQSAVQQAMGKALKGFVELVEAEFQDNGCTGAEIRDRYEMPLRQFMADGIVVSTLGQAFDPEFRGMDAGVLEQRWRDRQFPPLPAGFDWDFIAKAYGRLVKGIWRDSAELRELLKLHNQEAMRRGIDELVGIPPDFDLRKYQETLREQYGNLKLESLDTTGYAYNDLKLWRMFIPQDVRPCQEFNPKVYELPKDKLRELVDRGELDAATLEAAQLDTYHRSYREQPIQNVLAVIGRTAGVGQRSRPVSDYAVVLGDPGSGKSTLLQYVALQWAEQPIRDLRALAERPLPLLIELRKYGKDRHDQKCSSVVEYLHQGDVACRLNQQRLHEVLQAGDAIALFDGVDEVFDPHLRDVVVTDIHRFTNDYPQVQVIVTSRWLGYKAQPLLDAGFEHYMLQDLTDEQVGEFVTRWHDQTFPEGADKLRKRERLHRALRESRSIRQLAGNPLLLTMMAILNRNQELPRDRPELYTQASRVLLHQWDVERNLIEHRLDPVAIDYRDKQAMLRKVAYHMQSGAAGLAGNIISAGELERILTDHLRSMEVDKPREMARLMIKQLRERNFILCYLGADNYAFVHRTFLEFFAAWAFVWEFKETQTLSFEELRDQTFGSHWQEESWQEMLKLIAGMIETKFSSDLIKFLLIQKFLVRDTVFELRTNDNNVEVFVYRRNLKNVLFASDLFFEKRDRRKLAEEQKKLIERLRFEIEDRKILIPNIQGYLRYLDIKIDDILNVKYYLGRAVAEELVNSFLKVHSHDQELLKLLKKWTISDLGSDLNLVIFKLSAQNLSALEDISSLFKDRAQSDGDYNVRKAAIQALAQGRKDDPETLSILKNRAQSDDHYAVRMAAVQELAKGWKDDPTLLELYVGVALNDTFNREKDWQDNPRQIALKVLRQQYPEHPKTVELLQDRAKNDSDAKLRKWATEQLEQFKMQN